MSLLEHTLERLRAQESALKARGVDRLWLFGSVARGEARPESDVDLVAEIDPGARLSLTGFARLRADLSDALGAQVDLAEWTLLRPQVLERAKAEAMRVF